MTHFNGPAAMRSGRTRSGTNGRYGMMRMASAKSGSVNIPTRNRIGALVRVRGSERRATQTTPSVAIARNAASTGHAGSSATRIGAPPTTTTSRTLRVK
jgi:hypothetical protein